VGEKGDPPNCHGCAPLISISIVKREGSDPWKAVKFIKDFWVAGSRGATLRYRIQQFGKQFFLKQEGVFDLGVNVLTSYVAIYNCF